MADTIDPDATTLRASGPTLGTTAPRGVFGLPPKLLNDAARRLALLAAFVGAMFVVVQSAEYVAQPQLRPILADPVLRLTSLAVVLVAIGMYAAERYALLSSATLLGIGMGFEVLVCFGISMTETAWPLDPRVPVLGVSSVGLVIVSVGALIPNHPIWTLLTALLAATTWPLAYAVNFVRLDFGTLPPLGTLAPWPTINYLLAVLAFLIGRRIYGTTLAAQSALDLGSYRLEAPIGAGGMGEVWRASHQMLARSAAIKLIKASVMTGGSGRQADLSVKRFRREANAIARLQSPHTVYLYDFGMSREGLFYYVMELLDGINLQDVVTHFGPQPPARVVAILQQVCESLEEAHEQGLIHRDLKPSNIMICKLALERDFVKVLDFGLAKFVGHPETTVVTVEGVTAGTPGYMAPEVALGRDDVDARSDLYAIGCVAYFLLTGSLVFPDPNAMSMALKHIRTPPDPPSQRTELPIPADLERIVMQCLEKPPDARPATARAIRTMLAECHIAPWTTDDARRWWDHHLPPTSSLRSFAQPAMHTPAIVQRA
jgi:serine/threonine-protein kinase